MQPESTPDRLLLPLSRHLTRPQWQNLVALVVAVQLGRTLILRQLALFFVGAISSASAYRRLERVLSWEHGRTWKPLSEFWCRGVLHCFAPGRGRIALLIDWTLHRDRCRSLWIMLPVGGRAVPLAFWLAPLEFGGKGAQRQFEDAALRELRAWLPRRRPVVLIGDRGFRGTDRIRMLRELGFHFVLRITGDTKLLHRESWTRLHDLRPEIGQRWQRADVTLGICRPIVVHVVAVRQALLAPKKVLTNKGKPTGVVLEETTWFLATDLPLTLDIAAIYAWRMQVEQTFRDYKSLLGLEQERTKQPWARLHALLWAMMIGMTLDLCVAKDGRGSAATPPSMPEWPRRTGNSETAPKLVLPQYRSESETREGLHQFFAHLMRKTLPFSADLEALYTKSQRMQQRPQVRERKRSEPALRQRSRVVPRPIPA